MSSSSSPRFSCSTTTTGAFVDAFHPLSPSCPFPVTSSPHRSTNGNFFPRNNHHAGRSSMMSRSFSGAFRTQSFAVAEEDDWIERISPSASFIEPSHNINNHFSHGATNTPTEPINNNNNTTSSLDPARVHNEQPQIPSILLLNLVAIIWGSQHAIIKNIVQDSDVATFTFLRFSLASICSIPFLPGLCQAPMLSSFLPKTNDDTTTATSRTTTATTKETDDIAKAWRWGIEMGLWMFLGFSLQAIGLLTTTAQRSGFLLYLNVKFVPIFAYLFLGRHISTSTWVSALAAFSGTALLALDGQSIGLNQGDVWSVLAAMASAMFILRLEKAAVQVPRSSQLNAASLLVVAIMSGLWLLGQMYRYPVQSLSITSTVAGFTETIRNHPFEILYLGAISTALSNFLQARAQKDVPAERASIIYSLDPVYGALFSYLLLGETLGGVQSYLGAAMIFIAAATNSVLEFSKEE